MKKKILKIVAGFTFFIFILIVVGVTMAVTGHLYILTLVISNQNTDTSLILDDSSSVDPVHVNVTIDGKTVFDDDVEHENIESILGPGAAGKRKSLIFFGPEHEMEISTDANGSSFNETIKLESHKQFGVIEIKPNDIEFNIQSELNLY